MRNEKGQFMKESKPWNKGTKGICKPSSTSFKKGIVPWIKGKKFTYEEMYGIERAEEMKNKISESLKGIKHPKGKYFINSGSFKKGNLPWNKNKRYSYEELYGIEEAKKIKNKLSICSKGNQRAKGCIPWNKGKRMREETLKKWLKAIEFRPTSYERRLKEILDRLQPNEWRYTGDGSFWMGYPPLNPDFVNCNGKKIAIEVFACFHKERNFGSVENYITQRKESFSKYGWKTIFINGDNELDNEELILHKIIGEK